MRAFSNIKYDYYELTNPLGYNNYSGQYILPKGQFLYMIKMTINWDQQLRGV